MPVKMVKVREGRCDLCHRTNVRVKMTQALPRLQWICLDREGCRRAMRGGRRAKS